jgi:hypothetical protein
VLKPLDDYATLAATAVPTNVKDRTIEGSKLDALLNGLKKACEQYTARHHTDARAQRIVRLGTQADEEKKQLLAVMQNALYSDPGTTRSWEEAIAFQRAGGHADAQAKWAPPNPEPN